MDMLKTKEAVIKLTASLPFLESEDLKMIESMIAKMKLFTDSYKNFDPNNTVFSNKELRSINMILSSFKKSKKIIHEEIANKIYEENNSTYLKKHSEYFYQLQGDLKCTFSNTNKIYGRTLEDYQNHEKRFKIYASKNKKYIEAEKKRNELHDKLWSVLKSNKVFVYSNKRHEDFELFMENFKIDLNIKNHIALRYHYKDKSSAIYTASHSTIKNEIEAQFIEYVKNDNRFCLSEIID